MRWDAVIVLSASLLTTGEPVPRQEATTPDQAPKQEKQRNPAGPPPGEERNTARDAAAKKELQRLQGTWDCESLQENGKQVPADELKGRTLFFGGESAIAQRGQNLLAQMAVRLDPSKSPKTINAMVIQGRNKGEVMLGIYELQGDKLRLCFDTEGQKRPTEFK